MNRLWIFSASSSCSRFYFFTILLLFRNFVKFYAYWYWCNFMLSAILKILLNRFSRFLNFKILTIARAYSLKSFQLIAISICLLFHLILHQRIHQRRQDSYWLLKRNQLKMRFHQFISEWTQNSRFYTEAYVILYYF